jgi:hypothetical protein
MLHKPQGCLLQSLTLTATAPDATPDPEILQACNTLSSGLPLYSIMSLGFCQTLFIFDLLEAKLVFSYELARNMPVFPRPRQEFQQPPSSMLS